MPSAVRLTIMAASSRHNAREGRKERTVGSSCFAVFRITTVAVGSWGKPSVNVGYGRPAPSSIDSPLVSNRMKRANGTSRPR